MSIQPLVSNYICSQWKEGIKRLLVKDVPGALYQKFVELLLNVVVPDTFNDDEHVVELLNSVVPNTYNDVFIDVPAVLKRIASQNPKIVFNIMLVVEGDATVKTPIRLNMLLESCPFIWTPQKME